MAAIHDMSVDANGFGIDVIAVISYTFEASKGQGAFEIVIGQVQRAV